MGKSKNNDKQEQKVSKFSDFKLKINVLKIRDTHKSTYTHVYHYFVGNL